MSQASDDATRFPLAEAQVAEKSGDWLAALEKRNQAIDSLLQRPDPAPRPRPPHPDHQLETLGDKYQPTKRNHDYLRHYWRYFRDVRLSARKVVEIGVQTPRSIEMWEEF